MFLEDFFDDGRFGSAPLELIDSWGFLDEVEEADGTRMELFAELFCILFRRWNGEFFYFEKK